MTKKYHKCQLKFVLRERITDGPHETPEFIDEGVPFLSVDGIENNELNFENCRYISKEDFEMFNSILEIEDQPLYDFIFKNESLNSPEKESFILKNIKKFSDR